MVTRDRFDKRSERPELPEGDVSWGEYMERYAAHFMEFVEGKVIPLSPVHVRHDELYGYLRMLLSMFFAHRRSGGSSVSRS